MVKVHGPVDVYGIGKVCGILYVNIDIWDFLESLLACVLVLLYTQNLNQFDSLVFMIMWEKVFDKLHWNVQVG